MGWTLSCLSEPSWPDRVDRVASVDVDGDDPFIFNGPRPRSWCRFIPFSIVSLTLCVGVEVEETVEPIRSGTMVVCETQVAREGIERHYDEN